MMKKHDVVIVGAGIAGISAAITLLDKKPTVDVKIVSKDVGGRIVASEDGSVQYGAYFMINNYKNALKIITKGKRLNAFNVSLVDEKQYTISGYKIFSHPLQISKLLVHLVKFSKHYKKFKSDAKIYGQKSALESNEYLFNLFRMNAEDFAVNHGFGSIAKNYMSYWVNAISFTTLSNVSAFDLLRFSAGAFSGYYHYSLDTDALKNEWGENYIEGSVKNISLNDNLGCYEIDVEGTAIFAENVIVATPPDDTKKLVGLAKVKQPVEAYMFHVEGVLKNKWRTKADFVIFDETSDVISISKEKNGSYLLYAKTAKPEFDKYFSRHVIVATKHWSPAFNLVVDDTLIDPKIDEHMYLAGDFNICGVEDTCISGIYAANAILPSIRS